MIGEIRLPAAAAERIWTLEQRGKGVRTEIFKRWLTLLTVVGGQRPPQTTTVGWNQKNHCLCPQSSPLMPSIQSCDLNVLLSPVFNTCFKILSSFSLIFETHFGVYCSCSLWIKMSGWNLWKRVQCFGFRGNCIVTVRNLKLEGIYFVFGDSYAGIWPLRERGAFQTSQQRRSPGLCVLLLFLLLTHVWLFCSPVDHSPSRSSVHGVFQTRMREWGSSQPRDQSRIYHWATQEAPDPFTNHIRE